MTHGQRSGADEALPAASQPRAFHGPAGGIGAIQHPHGLAVGGRRFQEVAQRRDEGIDPAPQILQVDEDHVERVHHRVRRPAHLAIQAEHRDAMRRVVEVGRLDHVVLLVAAQPVLRTEGGGNRDVTARGQRVQRVPQVVRDRGGVGEQRGAPALERRPKRGVGEEPVDAEVHGAHAAGSSSAKAIPMMKIRLARRMRQRPVGPAAARFLDHRRQTEPPDRVAWQARQPIQRHRDPQSIRAAARIHLEARRAHLARGPHSVSILAEPVCRPPRRRREIELVIPGSRRCPDEGLEAGVPPQPVRPRRSRHGRHAQRVDRPGHGIAKIESARPRPRGLHVDPRRRRATRVWMTYQGLAHAGIVAAATLGGAKMLVSVGRARWFDQTSARPRCRAKRR